MLQTVEVITLSFLTDSERELIMEVLRRDEEVRRCEEQRVRRLKTELLEIRRKGVKRVSGNYARQGCGRCQEPLGRLATGTGQCHACNHRVCRNCRGVRPNGAWVCSVCAKEADLKKSTGDWFYDQRVNRFSDSPGHDIVRSSLRKRPELRKRETVGERLLQTRAIQPPPAPRLTLKELANEKPPPAEVSKPPQPQQEQQQRSDTESVEKTSLNSARTETESSRGTPVLPRREGVVEGRSTARSSPVGSCASTLPVPVKAGTQSSSADAPATTMQPGVSFSGVTEDEALFKRNPRRSLKTSEYSRPTSSVLDLRVAGGDVTATSMGDRSKSVPGLNLEEEEEEEDIDSLVETHRRTTGGSNLNLRTSKQRTLGSLLSVYSEAGDYVSVEVTGDIVFCLSYDERAQTFCVLVKECHGLACGDAVRQRSNPYVKCYLLPDKSRQSKRKTTTKRNTVNPTYNETLKYSITQSQLLTRSLQLSIWHHDRLGRNAFLGEVELPLDCRRLDSPHEECVTLREKVVPVALSSAFAQYKGELVISLKYVSMSESHTEETKGRKKKKKKKEEGGELHVLIKEAKNLTAMKAGGTSDSFVKGYLLPCKTKATKRKTPVVKKTLNPHYDHTFVYKDLRLEELKSMCLELTVWDREAMSSNDFLGGVRLSSGPSVAQGAGADWPADSTGEEVCLWQKMMQYPDSWAEGTLSLRSSMAKNK
ncbi:synaptotagmin-like protein 4 isoform X1 [Conger conger]|uniref:synaptotagmin-like protein 4 isoform X1 n=1 Tax=Conger conger TaxID=82655 RepID=UPI002A5AFD26|nr:synaptotagmin-like protein 4 isoform X1 [Conger conger]